MADDDAGNQRLDGAQNDDDGVREAVEATQATVHSALDRIRASREILADSLKPIDELLDDIRENGGRASGGSGGTGDARRSADGGGATGAAGADSPPPGA